MPAHPELLIFVTAKEMQPLPQTFSSVCSRQCHISKRKGRVSGEKRPF
jgi:hypothetical protein